MPYRGNTKAHACCLLYWIADKSHQKINVYLVYYFFSTSRQIQKFLLKVLGTMESACWRGHKIKFHFLNELHIVRNIVIGTV